MQAFLCVFIYTCSIFYAYVCIAFMCLQSVWTHERIYIQIYLIELLPEAGRWKIAHIIATYAVTEYVMTCRSQYWRRVVFFFAVSESGREGARKSRPLINHPASLLSSELLFTQSTAIHVDAWSVKSVIASHPIHSNSCWRLKSAICRCSLFPNHQPLPANSSKSVTVSLHTRNHMHALQLQFKVNSPHMQLKVQTAH